jgi:hypothetical protein
VKIRSPSFGEDPVHAPLAQDAAVPLDHQLLGAGLDVALGPAELEARREHPEAVGERLQLAVAALLAGGAEVVPLDEDRLDELLAHLLELGRVVLDLGPLGTAALHAAAYRPSTFTVQMRHAPGASDLS